MKNMLKTQNNPFDILEFELGDMLTQFNWPAKHIRTSTLAGNGLNYTYIGLNIKTGQIISTENLDARYDPLCYTYFPEVKDYTLLATWIPTTNKEHIPIYIEYLKRYFILEERVSWPLHWPWQKRA